MMIFKQYDIYINTQIKFCRIIHEFSNANYYQIIFSLPKDESNIS